MRVLLIAVAFVACKPSPPVRLVVFGDTGTGEQPQYDVGAAVAAKCTEIECDAVLMLGDNFYPNGVESVEDAQWGAKFSAPYASVTAPIWAVLGNHDYGGAGIGYEKDRAAAQVAMGARGGKFVMPDRFYSRTLRHVDFFALDTTAILFGDDSDQREAVRKWIKDSAARFRVVYGHHPYRSSGLHGDAGSFDGFDTVSPYAGERWRKLFAEELCGKIDLYIAGHDHDLEQLSECGVQLVVSGGGGADPRAVNDRHTSAFKASSLGYFTIELGTTLTITPFAI